ncbi:hypothetical protein AB7315_03500 [Providencia manganoxydans]|uniref:hypothetical protein n=1 Tax=Providencia manganoxydans TaxID=2923283 RepID=UPI0034E53810
MPIIGALLYFIPAIYFAVHVVKTHQNSYWLFILFVFPILGSIVYALVIWLPSIRYSRHGYKLENTIRKQLFSGKDLSEANRQYQLSPTTENCVALAEILADQQKYQEAAKYYVESLQGINQYSPDIMQKYAQVLFDLGDYQNCRDTLDLLCEKNPNFTSPTGHFLYAKVLAKLGLIEEANQEFRALLQYKERIEYKAIYAEFLFENQRQNEVMPLIDEVIKEYNLLPKSAKSYNKQWYQLALKIKNNKRLE